MAKPYRLQEIEAAQGSLDEVIPRLMNQLGTQKAVADRLGVSPTTISLWLKANGYVPVCTWQKEESNGEAA